MTSDWIQIIKATCVASALILTILAFDSSRRYLIAAPPPTTKAIAFSEENLLFQLASPDGKFLYPCRHVVESDFTQDWTVICGDGRPKTLRRFSVHLWLKTYRRETGPKATYEVFYWVKDHQNPTRTTEHSSGATIRLRLKEPSEISGLDLVHDVGDSASPSVLRAKISL